MISLSRLIWPSLHSAVIVSCRFHLCCNLKRASFLAMAAAREREQKQGLHLSCSGKSDSPFTSNHQGLLYVYENGYCQFKGHCRYSHAGFCACVSAGNGSPSTLENGDILCDNSERFSNCHSGASDDAFSRTESLSDGIGRPTDDYGKYISNGVPDGYGVQRLHIAHGCDGISHDHGGPSISDDVVSKSRMDGPSTEKMTDFHPGSVAGVEKEMQDCNGSLQNSHGSSFDPSSAGGVDSKDACVVTPEVETRKPAKRAFCKRCEKAQDLCICNRFKGVVHNTTKITILQNPKEKHHAVGSARVALLGLENVALIDVPEVYSKETFRIRPKVPGSKRSLAGRGGKKFHLKGGNNPTVAHVTVPSETEIIQIQNLLIEIFHCQSNGLNASETSQHSFYSKHNGGIHRGIVQDNSHDSTHAECGTGLKDGIMPKSRPPEDTGLFSEGVPCGENSDDYICVGGKRAHSLKELESLIPPGVALLYPSDKAIELAEPLHNMEGHVEQVEKTPCHLIVLDGTWSKARRIYFENPWLQSLPHFKLSLSSPSLYEGVRKQPKPGCLSTLESIVYALKSLEPDTEGLDGLLEVFDSMVEDQRRCKQMKCSVQECGIE